MLIFIHWGSGYLGGEEQEDIEKKTNRRQKAETQFA